MTASVPSEADDVAVPAHLALCSPALFVHAGIALALLGEPHLSYRLMVQIAEYFPAQGVHTAQVHFSIPEHGHVAGGMYAVGEAGLVLLIGEPAEIQVLENIGRSA